MEKLPQGKTRPLTHFYQDNKNIKHRGIGKTNYYEGKNRPERDFGVYRKQTRIRIYNVSLNSKIPNNIFPKISYDEFFKKLDDKQYCEGCLYYMIKKKLETIKK
jgi:hypothetical protein